MFAKQKSTDFETCQGTFHLQDWPFATDKERLFECKRCGGGEKSRSSWSPAKQEHRWMHDGTFGICFNIAHAILVRLFLEILKQHFTILQKLYVIY